MKNFQKGSANALSPLILLLLGVIVGYFVSMKALMFIDQKKTSLPETQSQITETETQSMNNKIPTVSTQVQNFNVSSKINSHDTRGSQILYSVNGKDVFKDSRFSFWQITIECTTGITAKDANGKNICNQANVIRTSDDFNVIISNANNKSVSVRAKAELLSEKDQSIPTSQVFVDTPVIPDFQGTIGIQLPISGQVMNLGSTEKIKFSAPYEIDGKTISISATNGETTYYLSDLRQTKYANPVSSDVEFSWIVGKYSHNSVTNKGSGILPAGNYKLQVIDGDWSSNYIPIVIK